MRKLERERDELLEAAKAAFKKYLTRHCDSAQWPEMEALARAIDKAEGRE